MRARTYKSEGIILKRVNFGEADRMLTILTRQHGKIRALAHGVRRPTSRKSSSVELFVRSELFFAKGRNLDIVTQAELLESFPGLRGNLKATKAAYHIVELVDLMAAEGQEEEGLYESVLSQLRSISDKGHATRSEMRQFERALLRTLGFGEPQEDTQQAIERFIESIVERRLSTVNIFKDI